MKYLFSLLLFISLIFLSATQIKAQVMINEFSSSSSDDWVELYSETDINISGWILRDTAASIIKTIETPTFIGPSSSKYYIVPASNRLNSDTDTVKIYKEDDSTLIDQVAYGGDGDICTATGNQAIGRSPNGSGSFVRFSNSTKGSENNSTIDSCPTSTPSSTPTSTPTATTTPTSTPTKTPTPKPSSTPTKSPTPKPTEEPSESPQVLGANTKTQKPSETPEVLVEGDSKKKFPLVPVILISSGVLIIGLAILQLIHARKNPQEN